MHLHTHIHTDPPSVTVTPEDPVVNQSDNAVLTCTAFGIPVPSLSWSSSENSGAILTNIPGEMEIIESTMINSEGQTIAVSILTIFSVQKSFESVSLNCEGNNSVVNLINSNISVSLFITVQG